MSRQTQEVSSSLAIYLPDFSAWVAATLVGNASDDGIPVASSRSILAYASGPRIALVNLMRCIHDGEGCGVWTLKRCAF